MTESRAAAMADDAEMHPAPDKPQANAPEALSWDSRSRRVVTIYVPLACFVIILLFPFYWMSITAFKPNAELYDYKTYNPFWIGSPTLDHIHLLLFKTDYPRWLWTTMIVAFCSTVLSLLASTNQQRTSHLEDRSIHLCPCFRRRPLLILSVDAFVGASVHQRRHQVRGTQLPQPPEHLGLEARCAEHFGTRAGRS